ncbi:MAG: cation:proton antiporter [Proteobacteria bacterium]|nr:cation:proton antiporter [Pseudomonadota bacterium]
MLLYMEHTTILTEIALVVLAALTGGLILARFRLPPILGYIFAGVLLGPSGLRLIESREVVDTLAQLGVLLLLFVIGMELNLRTFKKVWVVTTVSTLLQTIFSLLMCIIASYFFNWSFGMLLILSFIITLSSTAVVVKTLERMDEHKSEMGQITIGILIAQDLALIPMMLLLQTQTSKTFDVWLIFKLLISMFLTVWLINYLSQRKRIRLPLTQMIAGDKELTPIASLTFCFAAAAFSGLSNLSTEYGAFLAGLILGNTHERNILIDSTKPIQTLLLMIFFLSIGLLIDLDFIYTHIGLVVKSLLLVTFFKMFLNVGILCLLRQTFKQSVMISAMLAQLGEFSFLLCNIGVEKKLISGFESKLIISITVLSLALSPLWIALIKYAQNKKNKFNPLSWGEDVVEEPSFKEDVPKLNENS